MTDHLIYEIEYALLNFIEGKRSIYIVFNRLKFKFFEIRRLIEKETLIPKERKHILDRLYQYILEDPNYKDYIASTIKLENEFEHLIPLSSIIYDFLIGNIKVLSKAKEKLLNDLIHLEIENNHNDEKLINPVVRSFNLQTSSLPLSLNGLYKLLENKLYLKYSSELLAFLVPEEKEPKVIVPAATKKNRNSNINRLSWRVICLLYYLFFRSMGFTAKQLYDVFPSLMERVQEYHKQNLEEDFASFIRIQRLDDSDEVANELNRFSKVLLEKEIRILQPISHGTIKDYLKTSQNKNGTIFSSIDKGKYIPNRLTESWEKILNINLSYDLTNIEAEYNTFIKNPENYLERV